MQSERPRGTKISEMMWEVDDAKEKGLHRQERGQDHGSALVTKA